MQSAPPAAPSATHCLKTHCPRFAVSTARAHPCRSVVVLYCLPTMLPKLGEKLARELRNGAVVVSNAYPLPSTPSLRLVREVPVETRFLSPDVSSSLWCYRVERASEPGG